MRIPPAAALCACIALLAGLWAIAQTVRAADEAETPAFAAVGDDQTMWLIVTRQNDNKKLMILHRRAREEVSAIHRVVNVAGPLAPGGTAVAGGKLWVVYRDMSVQSLSTVRDPATGIEQYRRPRIEPGLPQGVSLRALAAAPDQPWALVSVQSTPVLREIDDPGSTKADDEATSEQVEADEQPAAQPEEPAVPAAADAPEGDVEDMPSAADPPPAPPTDRTTFGGPGDMPSTTPDDAAPVDDAAAPTSASDGAPDAAADAAAPALFSPVDRLLVLERNTWTKVDLPADWIDGETIALTLHSRDNPRLLVAIDADTLRVYEQNAEVGWSHSDYTVPGVGARGMTAVVVNQLLLVGVPAEVETGVAYDVYELWGGTNNELRGRVAISDVATDTPADFTVAGTWLALVVRDENGVATWTAMNLQGSVELEPTRFAIQTPKLFSDQPDRLVVVAVLAASMLILLVIWRRDPDWNKLNLPDNVHLADLSRRLMAAIIDLAPCLVASMLLFGKPLDDLHRIWPGLGVGWPDVLPGLCAIAMNVVHTTITEAFTAMTLGKMVMRIRVCTLDNKPPNVWQVLARNLLKAFDLIAWYVLPIIAMIVPNRQRLGDMVARTVVVSDDVEASDEE